MRWVGRENTYSENHTSCGLIAQCSQDLGGCASTNWQKWTYQKFSSSYAIRWPVNRDFAHLNGNSLSMQIWNKENNNQRLLYKLWSKVHHVWCHIYNSNQQYTLIEKCDNWKSNDTFLVSSPSPKWATRQGFQARNKILNVFCLPLICSVGVSFWIDIAKGHILPLAKIRNNSMSPDLQSHCLSLPWNILLCPQKEKIRQ